MMPGIHQINGNNKQRKYEGKDTHLDQMQPCKLRAKADARDKLCWWSLEVTHSDNQNFEKEKKKRLNGSEMSKQN